MIAMPDSLSFYSALLIGMAGGTHCMAMCGGISGFLGLASDTNSGAQRKHHFLRILAYNLGRIGSYTCIGFIAGSLGGFLNALNPNANIALNIFSGVLLIGIGIHIAGIWNSLLFLEKAGAVLWRRIQPLSRHVLPVKTFTQALLLGCLWGWLPCGLVYSSLVWSMASGSSVQSAWLMAGFGLGTLPYLFLTGVAGKKVVRLIKTRAMAALFSLVLIILGAWSISKAFDMPAHHNHSKHQSFLSSIP